MKRWLQKVRNSKVTKFCIVMTLCLSFALMGIMVSAEENTSSGVASDLSSFNSSITGALGDFTTMNLATILVAAIGICAGLVICWFAFRWLVRKISGALKKGRL